MTDRWRWVGAAVLTAALAGCGGRPPPEPTPPPPPPPAPEAAPPRPVPPDGAPDNLTVPSLDAAGLRQSVDRGITPAQTVWNLRSAYNVAALDCPAAQFPELIPAYKEFLKREEKPLAVANRQVDQEFRKTYGGGFVARREAFMTAVYNHFALPPTLPYVCAAVQAVARDAAGVAPADLTEFSAHSLPNIEVVFDDFYRRYDDYRTKLAAWNARWGTPAPTPTPSTQLPLSTAGPRG